MQARYLAEIQERFDTPMLTIPLLAQEVQGMAMLAELGEQMYGESVITDAGFFRLVRLLN